MEFIKRNEIKILSNPGCESHQLLFPENSSSERVTITKVRIEPGGIQPRHKHDTSEQIWVALKGKGVLLLAEEKIKDFFEGDVVRFADGDIHGLQNDTAEIFEYISVTSPPINFRKAYKSEKQEKEAYAQRSHPPRLVIAPTEQYGNRNKEKFRRGGCSD